MVIKIKNDVLSYDVVWFIWSKEEFYNYMIKQNIEVDIDLLNHWFSVCKCCVWYIYLHDKSDYILVHEIVHIVQWILDDKWINTWFDNTEILAYNIDWCFRKLMYKYFKLIWDMRYKNYY